MPTSGKFKMPKQTDPSSKKLIKSKKEERSQADKNPKKRTRSQYEKPFSQIQQRIDDDFEEDLDQTQQNLSQLIEESKESDQIHEQIVKPVQVKTRAAKKLKISSNI